MKIPKYLFDKNQVIILQQDQVINQSNYPLEALNIQLNKSGDVYLFIEDFAKKEISIDVLEQIHAKLYLILKSSIDVTYHFNIQAKKNASLEMVMVFRNNDRVQVNVKRHVSVFEQSEVTLKNAMVNMGKTNIKDDVYLKETYAKATLDVLNIGSYNDVSIVDQAVYHEATHTNSEITNSLISNANASLTYSVSGKITKGNEYSVCNQSNKGIILQETGEIEVEPKLYIDEYNVEASHGAAIGQMDEEQLYYLLSRGLSDLEARSLIISGYTKPFVDAIDDEDIRALVERQIQKKINEVDVL